MEMRETRGRHVEWGGARVSGGEGGGDVGRGGRGKWVG